MIGLQGTLRGRGGTAPDEVAKSKVQYARLTVDDAYRTLKFWTVRSASASPSVH